ncbi:unnamed protein product [Rotaria sordida]|uniref:Uncharacterized protein n=1 Tax=Rotaria sordida TaxID=392033 RepID=A0A813N121_9BILA|nr:unnamed protein product [Rotaria sordida]
MNQVQKNTNNQLSETLLEYGLSFATATQENPVKEPNDAIIEELVDIMEYVKELYSNYISTEFITKKYSDLEQSIRIKTIAETLYVRGQGYKQHIETRLLIS